MSGSSSRAPPPLRKLLEWDVALTKKTVDGAMKAYPNLESQASRSTMKVLEVSCHGIPWFGLTLISIYMLRSSSAREVQVNLLAALLYDVLSVAVLKAVTRRHRPPSNKPDMFFAHGPDKFSFPSGHASRAVLVSLFLAHTTSIGSFFPITIALYAWAAAVSVSRVLLRRHHILDVACGAVVGFILYALVLMLWVGVDTAKWVGDSIAGAEDEFDGS